MVFTEFVDMVEETFSAETVDDLFSGDGGVLKSGGAYTAVGDYDHEEMLELVARLAKITGLPANTLVYLYGRHLFGRFHERYPVFFRNVLDTFSFLESVHGHIHVEVRKLYADARPPSLQCRREGADAMVVDYRSTRPFAELARGLIDGCIAHFGDPVLVDGLVMEPGGRAASFVLRRGGVPEAAAG